MKDYKFLDRVGVAYLWKRMTQYVNGIIPKKLSQLENDRGYTSNGVTSVNGSNGDVTINVPTKVSQLQNDSHFITEDDIPTPTDVYTKSEVNSLLNGKQNTISDLSTIRSKADNAVPNTRKVNNKSLSSDITLNASDVGALPADTTLPTGIPVGGTTGQVLKKTSNSDYAVEWDNEEGGGGGSAGLDIIELTSSTGTLTDEQFALVQSDHCMIKRATGDASNSYRYYFKTYDSDSGCDYWCDTETVTANSVTRYYFTVDYTNQEYTFGSDVDDRKRVTANPTVSGTPADLTTITVGLTSYTVAANKADKVSSATNGNFAAFSNGNLIDSGHKHSDYLTSQDLSNYVQKSNTSGLLKNDGTVDPNTYLTSAHEVPAGGNAGQVLKKSSATDYDYTWANQTQDYPSAYCKTAAGTAGKTAACTLWTATANTYLHLVIVYANTSASALTLNVNSTGAKPIYINGSASSSSNYTLPAGSYIIFYDGTNYQFRTDGKIAGLNGSVLALSSDVPTITFRQW